MGRQIRGETDTRPGSPDTYRIVGVLAPGFYFGRDSTATVDVLTTQTSRVRVYMVKLRAGVARAAAERRITEAVERLIAFYQREKREGEPAPAFFQRMDIGRVAGELRDLEHLRAEDAVPEDFIDLAETAEFAPEVMDGECSA